MAASCLLWATGLLQCVRQAVNPSERPVRIFVTDARLDRFPVYAAAVKERQALSPTIWLVTGDLFADRSLAALTDGAAQLALLNRAGVDAVVLTPDWLSFGLPRLNQMVSSTRFYALSASLLAATGSTLGHPFMVRKSGAAALALTGIVLDSSDVLTRMAGVRYAAPDFAASKALALMRQRADFVGVMVEPRATGAAWGADFTVNVSGTGSFSMMPSADSGLVNCYDVSADAGRLMARTVDLGQSRPDSGLARLFDSLKVAADSIAGRSIVLPPGLEDAGRMADALTNGVLAQKLADGFLCDSLFVTDFRPPRDVGDLVGLLRDPGRLAILAVAGDALAGWPKELVLRLGLSRTALSRGLTYRIATTVDYLQRNPQMAAAGFELSPRPFWTICRDILESGQVK